MLCDLRFAHSIECEVLVGAAKKGLHFVVRCRRRFPLNYATFFDLLVIVCIPVNKGLFRTSIVTILRIKGSNIFYSFCSSQMDKVASSPHPEAK